MRIKAQTIPKGYKQTEIGVIPEDWEVKELENLVRFNNGKAHEQFIKNDGKYIVVNSKFISTEGKVYKTSSSCLSPLYKEEIVMVMSDIPNGKALAKCYFIKNDDKYTLNQRICSFKSLNSDSLYLFYKINRNQYFINFDSGVGQTNLKRNEVLSCPIAIPKSKSEQVSIATVLSDTDVLIEKLEKLIAKKQAIKQGTMQQLLTGKKRLPGFSGEWETKKLGDIANFLKGTGLSKNKLTNNGRYSCILYGELFTTYSQIIKKVKSTTNFKEGLGSMKGDILMPGSTTTTGIDLAIASVVQKDNILLGSDLIVIREKKLNNYNSEFLANYITHIAKNKIAEITQGITIIHLHSSRIRDVFVNIPKSIKEQTAIAAILSDVDMEIEKLENKFSKYKQIKIGMMQQLLTGKIRLIKN